MGSQMQTLQLHSPCPEKKPKEFNVVLSSAFALLHLAGPPLTTTQFVAGAVAAEVVTLAELAAVSLLGVLPVLALAPAAHAVSVVAADVGGVVFATGPVHVFCGHVVAAAFALSAHASLITPEKEN